MKAQAGSNLESLWGSIALGISIFGILIVIISGFYFIFTVNRKQKTEYGRLVIRACCTNDASLNAKLEIELFSLFVAPLFTPPPPPPPLPPPPPSPPPSPSTADV